MDTNLLQLKLEIPKEHYTVAKPTFYGTALKDVLCLAAMLKGLHAGSCPNHTIVDFDTGHWVHNALPDKVNAELLKWIEALSL